MSAIRVTKVSQCQEKKLKILGFEVLDIIALFFIVSFLNLITGPLDQRLITVWAPGLIMTIGLWLGKRGKPDGFLQHLLRFHLSPKHYLAFPDDGIADDKLLRSILRSKATRGAK